MSDDGSDQDRLQQTIEAADLQQFASFALEHWATPTYWIAESGVIVYTNRAGRELLGYSHEQMISMKMYEINVDLDPTTWPAIWALLKAVGQRKFEARHRHRDGRIFDVQVTANFLCLNGTEYSCAFVHELGARKALDRRLREAEKLEAVGRLAGGIAHDFNNQLAALLSYTEVLRLKLGDRPDVQELLKQQRQVIGVAAGLTSQLLTFSRPGHVVMQAVDLHELVRSVVGIASHSIDKQLQLHVARDAMPH